MTERTAIRFSLTRWRPGYDVSEVDDLIERIEATLARTAAPGQAVTADEVGRVQFSTTRLHHGYDQESVDNALDVYVKRLSKR